MGVSERFQRHKWEWKERRYEMAEWNSGAKRTWEMCQGGRS